MGSKNAINKLDDCINSRVAKLVIPREVQKLLCQKSDEQSCESRERVYPEILSPEAVELYGRVMSRFLSEECKKQKNVDNVIDGARLLLDGEDASDEPVDEDWLNKFLSYTRDVSSKEMKIIWSKILADEIKCPNTYSVRTMDALTKITKSEAMLFSEMCNYVVIINGSYVIIKYDDLVEKFGIKYEKIIMLDEAGLMDSNSTLSLTSKFGEGIPYHLVYQNKLLLGTINKSTKIVVPIYKLTKIGIELFKLTEKKVNQEYFMDVLKFVHGKNMDVSFSVHNVIRYFEDDSVEYEIVGDVVEMD